VILVHHTGVNEEAQHRARGSSAWRGALDIEVSVVPSKEHGGPIQIVQRKSKDAEISAPVWVELHQVEIPGWVDEDGQPVTSAVVVQADAPPERHKPTKLDGHQQLFEDAYWASGAEVRTDSERGELPYLSRSALIAYLTSDGCSIKKKSQLSAEAYTKPSMSGKPIADLLAAGHIEEYPHGWIVVHPVHSAAINFSRKEWLKHNQF
jgi:hypothetical protein